MRAVFKFAKLTANHNTGCVNKNTNRVIGLYCFTVLHWINSVHFAVHVAIGYEFKHW